MTIGVAMRRSRRPVLSRAVAAWHASRRVPGGRILKDISGHGHHAWLGSNKIGAVIDGIYVSGGTSGSAVSTPHSAALSVTGDVEVQARIKTFVYTGTQDIVCKRSGGSSAEYIFRLSNAQPNLIWYEGATPVSIAATVNLSAAGIPVGTIVDLKATRANTGGAGGNYRVAFYYSLDRGTTWTQLGINVDGASPANPTATANPVVIGSSGINSGNNFIGDIQLAKVLNGIGGTVVATFDPSAQPDGTTSWVGPQGNTWTVNQPATTTNDPMVLPYDTVNGPYAYFCGGAGCYVSTPDSAAVSITGDIDVRAKIAPDSWTPSSEQWIVAKYGGAGNRSFILALRPDGTLRLYASLDGTNNVTAGSNVVNLPAGTAKWIRATRSASTGQIIYYTSDDGATWTTWGSATLAAGAIFDSTQTLEVGAGTGGTANPLQGKVWYAEVRSGIGGTVVASFDASLWSEPFRYFSPVANLLDKDTSDIEGSIGGWTAGSNATVTRSTAAAAEGAASLLVTSAAAGSYFAKVSDAVSSPWRVPVTPGLPYTAIMDVKHGGVARSANAVIRYLDVSGTAILDTPGPTVTLTAAFQTLSATVTAPSNAVYMVPFLQVLGATAAGEMAYVDKVMVAQASSISVWSAGSVPWTANRPSTGRKLAFVDRSMLLLGTDDYLEILDHADLNFSATDQFTVVGVYRFYATPTGSAAVVSKRQSLATTDAGWIIRQGSGSPTNVGGDIGDGVANIAAGQAIGLLGSMRAVTMVRNVGGVGGALTLYYNTAPGAGTTDTTTGSLANTLAMRIGRYAGGSSGYMDMEFVAAAVFREALSATDIARLQNELLKVAA